jgi:hypothetical protein
MVWGITILDFLNFILIYDKSTFLSGNGGIKYITSVGHTRQYTHYNTGQDTHSKPLMRIYIGNESVYETIETPWFVFIVPEWIFQFLKLILLS